MEKGMRSEIRMDGNTMEWGTRVIQIMNPGFMGDFVGRHKAWATGSRIPGKHGTIVEAMYNKKCHDSLTQISSKRTTHNLLQKRQ